jgi:hypothetical protein
MRIIRIILSAMTHFNLGAVLAILLWLMWNFYLTSPPTLATAVQPQGQPTLPGDSALDEVEQLSPTVVEERLGHEHLIVERR